MGPMRARRLLCVLAASVGLSLLAACVTDYQKGLGDPNFGNANALAGQRQPGPSSETASDGSAGDAPRCVAEGSALVDGGACSVSFKTILTAFKVAGCHAASCHGTATPLNEPRIDPDDPDATWMELTTFKLSNGEAYVNPCSTEPSRSAISCNVNAATSCGAVMPPSVGLPSDVVASIDAWLTCGAPNN